MDTVAAFPHATALPEALSELLKAIADDGGRPLAVYQEPIGKHWQVFLLVPAGRVEPTPFQRDLSAAHLKRLTEVMKRLKRFTEPIVVVRVDGRYWTPDGNHRRAAAVKLGVELIPAILIPEVEVAYQILALNTEKVHNLKDKSLEVIRMYRGRIEQNSRAPEAQFAFEFERAHFITLGLLYEELPRFSGGAYAPILSRVDDFLERPLKQAMEERVERAAQLREADSLVTDLVARGRRRGLTHPYLRNFIVARANPLTRARKNVPSYKAALTALCKALREFDLSAIHVGHLAAAAMTAAGQSEG
jgi:ParB family transcriptional regulator, chromosome partitioning protein